MWSCTCLLSCWGFRFFNHAVDMGFQHSHVGYTDQECVYFCKANFQLSMWRWYKQLWSHQSLPLPPRCAASPAWPPTARLHCPTCGPGVIMAGVKCWEGRQKHKGHLSTELLLCAQTRKSQSTADIIRDAWIIPAKSTTLDHTVMTSCGKGGGGEHVNLQAGAAPMFDSKGHMGQLAEKKWTAYSESNGQACAM